LLLRDRPAPQLEQEEVELQVRHPTIEQLKAHWEAFALRVRFAVHAEQVRLELQTAQLAIAQLNRHWEALLLRT
jgi:hypothetical protein